MCDAERCSPGEENSGQCGQDRAVSGIAIQTRIFVIRRSIIQTMRSSGAVLARVGNDQGNAISDNGIAVDASSIIHLLRVYMGAVGGSRDSCRHSPVRDPSTEDPTDRDAKVRASSVDGDGSCSRAPASPTRGRPRSSPVLPTSSSRKRPRVHPDKDTDSGSSNDGLNVDGTPTATACVASLSTPIAGEITSPSRRMIDGHNTDGWCPDSTEIEENKRRREQPVACGGEEIESDGATESGPQVLHRIQAGCTLWDLSMNEGCAVIMCSAGLALVAAAVLQHCTDAESHSRSLGVKEAGTLDEGDEVYPLEGRGVCQGEGWSVDQAARLREITCGLLANVCSHRSLRGDIAGHDVLGEELLRAYHSSDDPACLTEILRLLASLASLLGREEAGRLVGGLADRQTLARLIFFLESSLEEKLLARACSLLYVIMYRCGDDVIGPLVRELAVEDSLSSLLNMRRNDLSYEQVGGAETGLDVLLRCLEVLSTSDISSIGPSISHVDDQPLSSATALAPQESHSVVAAIPDTEGPIVERNAQPAIAQSHSAATNPIAGAADGDVLSPGQDEQARRTSAPPESKIAYDGSGNTAERDDGAALSRRAAPPEEGEGGVGGARVRASIVRGLAGALQPWEHSRTSQQAALLVLGNILEAAEDGGDSPVLRECKAALEDALGDRASVGDGEEDRDGGHAREAAARTRAEFLENIQELSHRETSPIEEDLRSQLKEACAVVGRVLPVAK